MSGVRCQVNFTHNIIEVVGNIAQGGADRGQNLADIIQHENRPNTVFMRQDFVSWKCEFKNVS